MDERQSPVILLKEELFNEWWAGYSEGKFPPAQSEREAFFAGWERALVLKEAESSSHED